MRVTDQRPRPLQGVRVVDLSRLLPGPLCGQHFADLGAEVIKVEDTGLGDYARPALRQLTNRGKLAIRIDLKQEPGREVFQRLAATADVLIESFRPGTMERLGVGYEAISVINPRIVFCSITGYGQAGPRSREPGHDLNYVALTGVLDQTGTASGAPVPPGFLVGDILGGTLSAAVGILAALFDARTTGRGRHVDVSMADAILSQSTLALAEFNDSGRVHGRGRGSHTGGAPRYGVYATRDGRFLAVAAQEKKFWDAFCAAIGRPELAAAHKATGDEAEGVRRDVEQVIAQRTLAEWNELFAGVECCVTPVLTVEEALDDEHFCERGTVAKTGSQVRPGLPFRMTGHSVDTDAHVPVAGEDTDMVLKQLGYSPTEISDLRSVGAV